MTTISFTIPGRIGGKGRPRFDPRSKRAYTPKKTESQEGIVRFYANEAMHGIARLMGPVELSIVVIREPPKSWSRKKRECARHVTGKPDASNIQKLLEDAMNGIVYLDDSQIAIHHFERRYSTREGEGVHVTVHALETQV